MLPKKSRLNLSTRNRKSGRRLFFDIFDVIYRESDDKKGAVVVSKTIAKKAVDRNRTRRLIMEVLREREIKGEFVFIVKKNLAGYKKQDINEIFEILTKKINT